MSYRKIVSKKDSDYFLAVVYIIGPMQGGIPFAYGQ